MNAIGKLDVSRPIGLMSVKPATSRRGMHWIAAAAAFALVLSVQLAFFDVRPTNNADDFTAYVADAQSIAEGKPYGLPGYTLNPHYDRADSGMGAYPPGYPLILAPILAVQNFLAGCPPAEWPGCLTAPAKPVSGAFLATVASPPVRAAAIANCVFLALFAAALVPLALPLTGLPGAVAAGLVAGAGPVFLNQGAMRAPTESFYLLLLVCAFLAERLLHEPRRPGLLGALLLGGLIAWASLTRVTGILLAPAVILADLARRRRLAWPAFLASAIAAALFAIVIVGVAKEYVVQNVGVFTTKPETAAVADPIRAHVAILLDNLAHMPGNLTAILTYAGSSVPPLGVGADRARKAVTVIFLAFAAVGFAAQLRRKITAAETFAVLQILLLLNMTAILQSPRYWLPVSMLALVYAIAGGRTVGAWALRHAGAQAGPLVPAALALALAVTTSQASLARPDLYSLVEPRAQAALERLANGLPPGAVIIARRPRTIAFYTGHRSVDYHLAPVDPAFWPWAAEVGATRLLLSIDQPGVAALAGKLRLPLDDAGLNAALDAYTDAFFGAEWSRFQPVFDNGRYRLFEIVPLPAGRLRPQPSASPADATSAAPAKAPPSPR